MKILCLVTIINPRKVSCFPPSITHHAWYQMFMRTLLQHVASADLPEEYLTKITETYGGSFVLAFEDEARMNAEFDKIRLTDDVLLADLKLWEESHGISFHYEYYTSASITVPTPIIRNF